MPSCSSEDAHVFRIELRSQVHSTLESFAGITSIHGVPRIINSRSLLNRLFWSAVFVFALFMFIYTGKNLLEQYFSYPKKVNVEIVQDPVPFPSVTLCNTDHLDFIIVEKLEEVFNTVQNGRHYRKKVKPRNNSTQRTKDEEDFRKKYLKFQSTLSALMQHAALTSKLAPMSDFFEIMSRLGLVANLGPKLSSKAGLRTEDFIVYCRFMEDECNITKTFVKIFDPYFFNCFTFEPQRVLRSKSTRLAGIEYGFTVLLFLGSAGHLSKVSGETETMIPGLIQSDPALASSQSARVVIHAQNSMPHFTADGFDIPCGFSVSIGIKARQNVRVSLPHGNCTDEKEFKSDSKSTFKYTLISCQSECIQASIAKSCGCIDNRMPYKDLEVSNNDKNLHENTNFRKEKKLPFCLELSAISEKCRNPDEVMSLACKEEIHNVTREFNKRTRCRKEVHDRMTVKNPESIEACKCFPPCNDVVYDTSYSMTRLPDNRKQNSAFYTKVDQYLESLSSNRRRALKKKYGSKYSDEVKSRISRLNVHIADINIIKTTESPDYDLVRLVSDIGGQMGLWIGISVITLVEVVQLLTDISSIFLRKAKTIWDKHYSNSSSTYKVEKMCSSPLNCGDDPVVEIQELQEKICFNKLSTV